VIEFYLFDRSLRAKLRDWKFANIRHIKNCWSDYFRNKYGLKYKELKYNMIKTEVELLKLRYLCRQIKEYIDRNC